MIPEHPAARIHPILPILPFVVHFSVLPIILFWAPPYWFYLRIPAGFTIFTIFGALIGFAILAFLPIFGPSGLRILPILPLCRFSRLPIFPFWRAFRFPTLPFLTNLRRWRFSPFLPILPFFYKFYHFGPTIGSAILPPPICAPTGFPFYRV